VFDYIQFSKDIEVVIGCVLCLINGFQINRFLLLIGAIHTINGRNITAVRIKIKRQILHSYFIRQCHLNPLHHRASRGEKGVIKLSSTRVCKDHVYIRQLDGN